MCACQSATPWAMPGMWSLPVYHVQCKDLMEVCVTRRNQHRHGFATSDVNNNTRKTRDLSTTLSRGITRQVLATVLLHARLNGHPAGAGLPVATDDPIPVAGGPSSLPLHPSSNPLTTPASIPPTPLPPIPPLHSPPPALRAEYCTHTLSGLDGLCV